MDRYFHLAFQGDGRWNFDDINQTSPPIDTQNIVSGTNRYKFGTFTQKILSLIRLEVLNSSGKGISLLPETLDEIGNVYPGNESGRIGGVSANTFQELYVNASSGTPAYYIKYGDFIYLRDNPNYSKTSGLIAYFNRPASGFNFATFTVTIASPGVFSATAHGLALNDKVVFETDGALPTGLTAGTVYYVITTGLTADAFQVSATQGGSAVNTSGSQSGNHSFLKTNKEPGVPAIHHFYLARYASLPFLLENSKPQISFLAVLLAKDELDIIEHFSRRDKDTNKCLIPAHEDNR